MASPFVGEIRLFAGNFAPAGWSFCDGSVIAISQNEVLYTLIGTTYGGDGVSNFKLPDLRSRVPAHQGAGAVIGQSGGVETVTLTGAQMPPHSHALNATNAGGVASPANALPAALSGPAQETTLYGTGAGKLVALNAQSISPNAGGQPHGNIQPYQAITFIIALVGVYPSQN